MGTAKSLLASILAMTFLSGCVSTVDPGDYTRTAANPLATPGEGKAIAHVFMAEDRLRETLAVTLNGELVGGLGPTSYFSQELQPGHHIFEVSTGVVHRDRERVSFHAEAGETYYLRYTPGGYMVVADFNLVPSETARPLIPSLDYITLNSTPAQ